MLSSSVAVLSPGPVKKAWDVCRAQGVCGGIGRRVRTASIEAFQLPSDKAMAVWVGKAFVHTLLHVHASFEGLPSQLECESREHVRFKAPVALAHMSVLTDASSVVVQREVLVRQGVRI